MKHLKVITILSIFLVLYLVAGSLRFDFPDFQDHSKAAERIARGEVLYRDHISYLNVYHYPPVYLYTLGAVYYVTGVNFMVAKGLLALLNVMAAALIYLIAKGAFEEKYASFCLLLFLVNPLTFSAVFVGYFDNFVVFFILLSFYLVLKNRPAPAGVALAAAFMSKPFPILVLFVFLPFYTEKKFLKRFFIPFLLTVGSISAPFLLLAPEQFVRYAFLYNFERVPDSLSFYYYFLPGFDNHFIPLAIQAVFIALVSLSIRSSKIFDSTKRNGSFLMICALLVFFGFLIANRVNYPHYLIYTVPFFSLIFVDEYISGARIAGIRTWQHLLLAFSIILLGSFVWSSPWSHGIADFKSSIYSWAGATVYFLGGFYFLLIIFFIFKHRISELKMS